MFRLSLLVLVLAVLTACALPGRARPAATPDLFPGGPTRAALPSVPAAPPTVPPAAPSATVNLATLPQLYEAPGVGLQFRYPPAWIISENSTPSEWLITAQSGQGDVVGLFSVNLVQVGGPLDEAQLRTYADRYLATLFGDFLVTSPPSYRSENGSLIATVKKSQGSDLFAYELRFRSESPFVVILLLLGRDADWPSVAPLLDEMARSVAVAPPPSVAGLPTATALSSRGSEGLTALIGAPFTSSTGALHAVGMVQNSAPFGYEDVQVTATLFDAAGTVLATSRWPIVRQFLPSNGSSPVRVIFESPPAGATSVEVAIEGRPATTSAVLTSFQTTVTSVGKPPFGEYGIQGTMTNTGPTARAVTLTGVIYDATGMVLGLETIRLQEEIVESGASAPFSIALYSRAPGDIARHEVLVEGMPADP